MAKDETPEEIIKPENNDVETDADETPADDQTNDNSTDTQTDKQADTIGTDDKPKGNDTEVNDARLPAQSKAGGLRQRLKRLFSKPSKKQLIIVGGIVSILLLCLIIPAGRNVVYGSIFKTTIKIEAYDELEVGSGTDRIQLNDLTILVDGHQQVQAVSSPVTLTKVKPGKHVIEIRKPNYKTEKISLTANLGLGSQNNVIAKKLIATGIPVTYTIKHYLTGATVAGVTVESSSSKATSNADGKALIILPIQKSKDYDLKISGTGYLSKTVKVTLGKQDSLEVIPDGQVYFLSKDTGKIDVVKTNIDGSERKTVLAGTGKEDATTTTMISTTDWKYLALSTHRADKKSQIIIINTADDTATTVDEGNAIFTLQGWDGHTIVYQTENKDIAYYTTGRVKIKGYDADAKKLTSFYKAAATGNNNVNDYEYLFDVRIVKHRILFSSTWYGNGNTDLPSQVNSINIATGTKKKLYEYSTGYLQLTYSSVDEAYYSSSEYKNGEEVYTYFEVDSSGNWKKSTKPDSTDQFTYFTSPDKKKLLWSEERDGKQTVFIGDDEAKNAQKIYTLSELQPYAWFTDDYALYSKKGSELYIASIKANSTPRKIADYHRPSAITFVGYGGGGGGPY